MLRRLWRRFLATYRLSKTAVCEESARLGPYDYHDFPDDILGTPAHFVELECERCGKRFLM